MRKAWDGEITSLKTGGQRFGHWSLASPTTLRIAGSQLKISPFRLQGEGKEFLQAEANLAFSPRRGRISSEWQELDLRRANPWIRNVSLAGRSSGSARIEWLPGDRLDLQGRVQAAGSFSRSGSSLHIRDLQAELAWGPGGMQASWEADLGGTGALNGRATSGLPAHLGVPAAGEVTAHWQLKDLAALSPWLPGVRLDGRSSGEVSGRWREDKSLAVAGRAELSGHVAYQQRRLTVRQAKAQIAWDQQGLAADLNIDLGEGGRSSGHLTSAEPARLAIPRQGDLQARWQGVDLSLLSPWLPETEIAGHSSGSVDARWQQDGRVDLDGRLDLAGRLKRDRLALEIPHAEAALRWNGDGLRGRWTIGLAPAGEIAGEIRSAAPARLSVPERGTVQVQWEKLDLALLRPWMPSSMLLEGTLAGRTEGEWLPGRSLRLTGTSEVRRGELEWEGESGVITAALRQAKLDWNWQGENLRGDMTLALEHYGRAEGTFQLPLPARLPTAMEASGPVRGRLTADLQEEGLLNAFFPGLVQESSGKLGLDLRLAGTLAGSRI